MSRILLKLRLILWKNLIIRKRHWLLTLFEIIIPTLLCIVNLFLTSIIPSPYNPDTIYYEVQNLDTYNDYMYLYYAPNSPMIEELMAKVDNRTAPKDFMGFGTEDDMISYIQHEVQNNTENYIYRYRIVAVVFDDFPKNKLPTKLKYRIRTYMDDQYTDLFPDFQGIDMTGAHNDYVNTFHFITLQHALDMSYLQMVTDSQIPNLEVTLQQMPYPPHRNNMYTVFIKYIFPTMTLIGFLLLFLSVLKRVIEEKSTGIKELMKMMGLKSWMCWLGWFIYSMMINIISVTCMTLLFAYGLGHRYPAIFVNGNPLIVWIFLFLYCVTTLCFIFAISTVFKKPTLGTCGGLMIWLFLGIIGDQFVQDNPNSNKFLRCLFTMVPNIALKMGFNAIIEFEKRDGIGFNDLWTIPNKYQPHPTMGKVLFIFIIDSIVFTFLTWYIENVYPGEYGVARPWYFPFTKSYWLSNKVRDGDSSLAPTEERDEVEKVTNDMKVGIQIRNLHKSFSGNQVVKGLSFDIYQNHITVLLGHNGAGKTTTMNMITGMTSPSKGSIVVNGYDIYKHMDTVRKSLGLCPQFDVQFTDLTVLEHLMFFAMLRGYDTEQARIESLKLLNGLNLLAKVNVLAGELSGGMRRKLSLAMAVVGASDILILDEPTSGLDPEARREIWDFLLNMRGERTILITTHYMEEADILGDRIAIMHDGSLKCYGSTLFLKKHYGTGYILSVLVQSEWNLDKLTNGVTQYISSAKVKSINGNCVTFTLPTNDTTALSNLFINLENNKRQLNISNFGVSITTMEEVFLRVGEIADELDRGSNKQEDESKYLLTDCYSENMETPKVTASIILNNLQLKGLLLKRFHYSTHKWVSFLTQILVPLAIIILALTLMKVQNDDDSNKPLDAQINLELNKYTKTRVFYSNSPDTITQNLANIYSNLTQKQNAKVIKVPEVSDAILAVGKKNMDDYERSLIVSAEFNSTGNNIILNGMYGSLAYHGPPIALNLLSNTLLKYVTKGNLYSINVTNNPIPYKSDMMARNLFASLEKALSWMFLIPLAFTIMIGLFIVFPQEERLTGVMHLQIMSGVPRWLYWVANFLFDISIYIMLTIIMIILILFIDFGGSFGNPTAIGALIILLITFGFGTLPFAYIFTYRKSAAGNMTILFLIQIIIGAIGSVIIVALMTFPSSENGSNASRDAAMYTLYIFPHFAFSYGIFVFTKHAIDIHTYRTTTDLKEKMIICGFQNNPCCENENTKECLNYLSYFSGEFNDSLKNQVIFMIVHFFVYFALLLFLESGIPRKYFNRLKDIIFKSNLIEENLNDDVIEEKNRVETQLKSNEITDVLLAKSLKKWYGRNVYAARDLNFGVKTGECFGLLGVNGAGKTTTFKMLTGDIPPSDGESYIHGLSLQTNRSAYLKNIGYCPQFDALNFTLTGREILTCFAYLRGVQENKIKSEVDKWLYRCGIKQYENKICKKYSGGNKRKLSTAVALIGDPSLIMLDEPTCGVDPVARRKLWDVLSSIRKIGQSIVLTTHSMEECEALCDRLAIMVDGQFRCIGNIQTLKSKFGQGFTVIIKLRSLADIFSLDMLIQLKELIERKFNCTLKDEHMGMLHYHINPINTSIGDIFSFMETLKTTHKFVEDYTVNDTSLEEVFLSFAKTKYISPSQSAATTPNIV